MSNSIGYCETCKFRDWRSGHCVNPKLSEDDKYTADEEKDMLIYSYTEGGSFYVGPLFGCVHHSPSRSEY